MRRWLLTTILTLATSAHAVGAPLPDTLAAAVASCARAAGEKDTEAAKVNADRAIALADELLAGGERPRALLARSRVLVECRMPFAEFMAKGELLMETEKLLARALAADPAFHEARLYRGTVLFHVPPFLGKAPQAIADLETVTSEAEAGRFPAGADAWAMLAELHARGGDARSAAAVKARGRARFPEDPRFAETRPPKSAEAQPAPASGEGAGEALAALVESERARAGVAGLAVGVAMGDQVILSRGFGSADLENGIAMTPHSVVRLGSVSKHVVAAALLKLAERGVLRPEDPLSRHLAAPGTDGIRLEHLLTHTAGLPRDLPAAATGDRRPWWERGLAAPRAAAPGTKHLYSNLGYALLGKVLENASGKPMATVLHETVFAPLRLTSMRFCDEVELVPHRARGYQWMGDRFGNAEPLRPNPALAGAGGLCSSLGDLLAFEQALHGGRLLSAESYRRMTAPARLQDGSESAYGFGLALREPGGRRAVEHSGGIQGFLSHVSYFPDSRALVIVLANSEGADPSALRLRLAEALHGGRG